jgi:hypothetical protein
MRETRTSGSMRGRYHTVIGHVPLIPFVSPYSTSMNAEKTLSNEESGYGNSSAKPRSN